jgi:cell division septum initiation protein DivIVA
MSDFDRPGATLPGPVKQRPKTSRFANLGDRLARTFGGYDRDPEATSDWDPTNGFGYADGEEPPRWDPVGPRFPLARLGYDRSSVDEHVAELERELAELQTRAPSADAVSAEIEKVGEQTSAILTVAHDRAHEMTRQAQEQADRCLADAASNAVMITEDAKRRLRQLDSDTDAVWRERARLIEDVRTVSGALASLANDAVARFPAEPERPEAEPTGATPPESADAPHPVSANGLHVEAHGPAADRDATVAMPAIAEDERPEDEQREGEQPEGERPEGERPEGERPEGERPEGERPEGERPEDGEPWFGT